MRRNLLALAPLWTLLACGPDAAPPAVAPATPADAAEVARVIDDWHEAAAKADEARYFAHFTSDAIFLGTDGRERWDVPAFRAYAHPRFASGKAWTIKSTRRAIRFLGSAAWFEEDLDAPNLGPSRGSGVLVRVPSGEWKIAQYNLSVPIPNDRFRDVRAVIDGKGCAATP